MEESDERAGWNKGQHGREVGKGIGGNEDEILPIGECRGYKTKIESIDMIEIREEQALADKVDEEEHFAIYGRLREGMGVKTNLHGLMDYAKKFEIDFGVGDLHLSEQKGICQ